MTATLTRAGASWTLDLGDDENLLTGAAMRTLLDLLGEAAREPAPLVTRGAGRFFTNGMDPAELSAPEPDPDLGPLIFALMARVLAFPAVTVAAVNGHAFGGGAVLVAAHDRALMRADRGFWCLPEAHLGMPLGEPLLAVLATRLRSETLSEAVLTGRRYPGPEAQEAGVVEAVRPPEELAEEAVRIASAHAGLHPPTLLAHKRWLHRSALAAARTAIGGTPAVAATVADVWG